MTAQHESRLAGKLSTVALVVGLAEVAVDGSVLGSALGAFALVCITCLMLVRRASLRNRAGRIAVLAAIGLSVVLVDDPSLLAWSLFCIAVSLAALSTRRGFDDAFAWARRLVWHGLAAPFLPLRDLERVARLRAARGYHAGSLVSAAAPVLLPLGGGGVFLALFAGANPLIGNAFAQVTLPDTWTVLWRGALAGAVALMAWATLRPSTGATAMSWSTEPWAGSALEPRVSTLVLSLVTFNALFAIENLLDILFLWSGAALPAGVTMADYAHRGAYSLIVTALLAGAFVLVALRPDSTGAGSPIVRRLVTLWIGQNLLLVASSILRTLDYVDAYSMTVLRLSALLWMALVAAGLVLIGWRLLRARSAAWLINANALAAALVLAGASVVDLGSVAAAWNVEVALRRGRAGPELDLCYLARLEASALVSLARLETRTPDAGLRDRITYLRWHAQADTTNRQANWRSWTWRTARRLRTVEALVGVTAPRLLPAPNGRDCDGSINPPPAPPSPVAPLGRSLPASR